MDKKVRGGKRNESYKNQKDSGIPRSAEETAQAPFQSLTRLYEQIQKKTQTSSDTAMIKSRRGRRMARSASRFFFTAGVFCQTPAVKKNPTTGSWIRRPRRGDQIRSTFSKHPLCIERVAASVI